MNLWCFRCAAVVTLLTVVPLMAATKYPGLNFVHPVAIQQGKSVQVLIDTNGDIKTAHKVLVEGAGVTAKVLPRDAKLPAGQVRVEFTVSAAAAIGPREIRVADKAAITTAGIVYITAYPVVEAGDKIGKPETAQALAFPQVVCGRLERDVDEDWFRFTAKKGEQVNFSVLGARLHNTMHKIGRFITHMDASLLLTDSDGNEIAANDDFYFADPQLSFVAPRDGEYRLRLSEATYKGNPYYTYALVCTKGPFARQARPFGIPAGQTVKRTLYGPGVGAGVVADFAMPSDVADGEVFWIQPRSSDRTWPEVPMFASSMTSVFESEPNNTIKTAQNLVENSAISGTIDRPGDADVFRFEATKGQSYDFEIFARRLFSPLDSEVAVMNAKGGRLADNDDYRPFAAPLTKDSALTWKAPASGIFFVRVRDKLGRGGPDFAYSLRFQKCEPDFELTCDPVYSMVGPGSRSPMFIRVDRRNGFDAPIHFDVRGVPKGVRSIVEDLKLPMTDALLVLIADADAPIDAANLEITGTADVLRNGKPVSIKRRAIPLHEIYQAQRRAGRTVAIAVTELSDVQVETTVGDILLKPGESKEIPVTVKRAAKYKDGPVTLWENWRFEKKIFGNSLPPGVTVDPQKSKLALNGNDSVGKITITAAKDAKPCEPVLTTVIAQVAIEFSVFVPYCTAPFHVGVAR